jgi:probable rRNA maturation factor
MITLEISEGYQSRVESHQIEKAALTTLKHQSPTSIAELTIVITDDEQLRQLNHQFRNVDATTDVLSFPVDFLDPESEAPYLGDVVISFPRARLQAEAGGHATLAELQLLTVHGILHLLGHDHAEPVEKARMWATQREILQELGLENLQITGDE